MKELYAARLEEIAQGFAQACFTSAWTDAWEELREHEDVEWPWAPGSRIEDAAPTTPDVLLPWALDRLRAIVVASGGLEDMPEALVVYFDDMAERKGHLTEPKLHDFGWYLAMEWLGHGVNWSDDHPDHDLVVGYGEFTVSLDEADTNKAYIDSHPLHVVVDLSV